MEAPDLKVLQEMRPIPDQGLGPEQKLALAVLVKAVSDVRSGNAYGVEAAAFLQSSRSEFWLQLLGATARGRERVRREAARLGD
ncbi:MAG TPA: hypothetical protein VLU25_17980 [Acidobacteriota bacterium]|nr:hypothetical protein [Acidobacteriota bacterium]